VAPANIRRASAPAKVNLYLRVTGRRADGYHLLDSLVVFVDLADELIFSLAPKTSVQLHGPFARAVGQGENLVERAARLLQAAAASADASCAQPGATIAIEKNIPVAAGLGGAGRGIPDSFTASTSTGHRFSG